MSGWLQLTVREREVLRALVEDGIEVQGELQAHMLAEDNTTGSTYEEFPNVEHFIQVIQDTEEPRMVMEGLLHKLRTSLEGGENERTS